MITSFDLKRKTITKSDLKHAEVLNSYWLGKEKKEIFLSFSGQNVGVRSKPIKEKVTIQVFDFTAPQQSRMLNICVDYDFWNGLLIRTNKDPRPITEKVFSMLWPKGKTRFASMLHAALCWYAEQEDILFVIPDGIAVPEMKDFIIS